jgi:putative phage-type endonuclease
MSNIAQKQALNEIKERVDIYTPSNREDWLNMRLQGIGASESIALYGKSDYLTPYGLYCLKKELTEYEESEDERMCLGRHIEGGIIATYKELYNVPVYHNKKQTILTSKENPFMFFTPDGFTFDDDNNCLFVEVKSSVRNEDWKDELGNIVIPLHIQVQLQHQMCVSETPKILLLLELYHHLYPIWIKRNDAFIVDLIKRVEQFKYMLDNNIEPDIEANDTKILSVLLKHKKVKEVELEHRFVALDRKIQHYDRKIKALSKTSKDLIKRRDALKNRIKKEIGGVGVATLPNGVRYITKIRHKKGKYSKSSKSISLTRKE